MSLRRCHHGLLGLLGVLTLALAGCGDNTEPDQTPVIDLTADAAVVPAEGGPMLEITAAVRHQDGADVHYTWWRMPEGLVGPGDRFYSFGFCYPAYVPPPFGECLAAGDSLVATHAWDGTWYDEAGEARYASPGEYRLTFRFSYREDPQQEPTHHLVRSVNVLWPGR